MPRKYAYSYDREDFTGSFESPELAFAEAVSNSEGLSSPPTTIYIGTLVEADPQAADHAAGIIEDMNRRAHVDYGDSAAKYLRNVAPALVKELDAALAQTIVGWLKKNNLMPTFVRIQAVREYPVVLPAYTAARVESDEVGELGVEDQPVL